MRLLFVVFALLLSENAYSQARTTEGRFQLIQLSSARRDQYLLDTQTGRMWSPTCFNSQGEQCVVMAWVEEKVAGLNTSLDKINAEALKGK